MNAIIEIIKYIIKSFTSLQPGNAVADLSESETFDTITTTVSTNNDHIDKAAQKKAKKYILKNLDAYRMGLPTWQRGIFKNNAYNDMQYTQIGSKFYKVYRDYSSAGFTFSGKEKIKATDFKKGWSTWCNVVAGVFCMIYDKDIGNTQFYKGTEYTANKQIANIANGFYDTDCLEFIGCWKEEAEMYGKKGGLALATWQPADQNKAAHIAVVLGEDKIIQGGFRAGLMSLVDGFGQSLIDDLKYYKLVKVIEA